MAHGQRPARSRRSAAHSERHSGLQAERQAEKNIDAGRFAGAVTAAERATLLAQTPVTIWLTGLSGAGKSTLAFELERRLVSDGHACYVLDGDAVRHGLTRDLGFSREARRENIRRVAHVAQLMNDAGLIVIASLISPMREDRAMARSIIGEERFIETWLSAPLDVCVERDPKGLYARAYAGEIASFTGVSAPYEAPDHPALEIDTATLSVGENVAQIVALLRERHAVFGG